MTHRLSVTHFPTCGKSKQCVRKTGNNITTLRLTFLDKTCSSESFELRQTLLYAQFTLPLYGCISTACQISNSNSEFYLFLSPLKMLSSFTYVLYQA